jgi:hypothetical protein
MSTSCDVNTYQGITKAKINAVLDALKKQGATLTGSNPWLANVHKGGVILKGTWSEPSATLVVSIDDKAFYAPCGAVWDAVDPMVKKVQAMPEPAAAPSDPNDAAFGKVAAGQLALSAEDSAAFKSSLDKIEAANPSPAAPSAGVTALDDGSPKKPSLLVLGAAGLGLGYVLYRAFR